VASEFATVDEYISAYPEDVRAVLERIRATVRKVAPDAGEKISYGMPTMTLDGHYLVYFAAWKKHVSLYPLPELDDTLEKELAPYRSGKGTAKFPLTKPIPYDLIERLVTLLAARR
jgi:uncharacterized protein YdhG (YjbR/CyaY superfamily)